MVLVSLLVGSYFGTVFGCGRLLYRSMRHHEGEMWLNSFNDKWYRYSRPHKISVLGYTVFGGTVGYGTSEAINNLPE